LHFMLLKQSAAWLRVRALKVAKWLGFFFKPLFRAYVVR
jgi:hypothetical protein